jgi:hypothetical protein
MGNMPLLTISGLLRESTLQEHDAMVSHVRSVAETLREIEVQWRLAHGIEALEKWQVWVIDRLAVALTVDVSVYSIFDETLHSASSPALLKLFENTSQMVLKIPMGLNDAGKICRGITIGTRASVLANDLLTEASLIGSVENNVPLNFKISALLDALASANQDKALFLTFSQWGTEMASARRELARTEGGQRTLQLLAPYRVTARSGWVMRLVSRTLGRIF